MDGLENGDRMVNTLFPEAAFALFHPMIENGVKDINGEGRRQRNQKGRQPAFNTDDALTDQPYHKISDRR